MRAAHALPLPLCPPTLELLRCCLKAKAQLPAFGSQIEVLTKQMFGCWVWLVWLAVLAGMAGLVGIVGLAWLAWLAWLVWLVGRSGWFDPFCSRFFLSVANGSRKETDPSLGFPGFKTTFWAATLPEQERPSKQSPRVPPDLQWRVKRKHTFVPFSRVSNPPPPPPLPPLSAPRPPQRAPSTNSAPPRDAPGTPSRSSLRSLRVDGLPFVAVRFFDP